MNDRLRALAIGAGMGVAGVVVSYVLLISVGGITGAMGVEFGPLAAIGLTLVLTQGLSFGGTAIAYFRWRGLPVSAVGISLPSLRQLGIGVGAFLLSFGYLYVASIVVSLLGAQTADNQIVEFGAKHPEVLLLLIPAAYIFIGPGEELLFRGVVQGRIRESFDAVPAVVLASIIFAGIHAPAMAAGAPLSAKLTTLVILLGPSLILGAVYEYTGNLVIPALIHATYDAVLFAALFVAVKYGQMGQQVVLPV